MLHTGVLLPYALLWLLSYGQNCIGVSVLAYALFIYVATIKSILNYDGAAHKGLDPKVFNIFFNYSGCLFIYAP